MVLFLYHLSRFLSGLASSQYFTIEYVANVLLFRSLSCIEEGFRIFSKFFHWLRVFPHCLSVSPNIGFLVCFGFLKGCSKQGKKLKI